MAAIDGYRDLSDAEIKSINELKKRERQAGEALDSIEDSDNARHVALARTYLEIGFMFAVKAIARPSQ